MTYRKSNLSLYGNIHGGQRGEWDEGGVRGGTYLKVLGQLPTGDNSPPDKDKAQLLPTRTMNPRTTPH